MYSPLLGLLILIAGTANAGPFFKDGNQLEIRKYRFSRHTNKGFERLVLEFDHLGSNGNKPTLKVESSGFEAKVTLLDAHLSGIIPESEINKSYLTRSRYLGPVTIAAEKGTFNVTTNLKKSSSVEAFWMDKPARLVVDVFPMTTTATRATGRKIASLKGSAAGQTTPMAPPKTAAKHEVFCFPQSSQLQASIAFDTIIETSGESSASSPTPEGGVVCFPATARLTPQIAYKLAPYPSFQMPPLSMTPAAIDNALAMPPGIQTDLVGGSQKIPDNFAAPETPLFTPPAETAPPTTTGPSAALEPEPMVPTDSTTSLMPVTPLDEALPALTAITPISPIDERLPASAENTVAPGEAAPDTTTPFPTKKKKKKKVKPRLPQLPPSITEGALLPPVK